MKDIEEFWNRLFGKPTFRSIQDWLTIHPQLCPCGKELRGNSLRGKDYEHPNGVFLHDIKKKVWLYCHCRKCGYDLSYSKWRKG